MIGITGVVSGDKRVVAHLEGMTPRVRTSIESTMLRISADLGNKVRNNKLSGQLLKRRTGTLARSIQFRVVKSADEITGITGSRVNESAPLKYAYPLEEGFDGTVTVREHLRMMKTAFGKPVKNPRTIKVGAHSAQRHIKAYHYLRSSLAENRAAYIKELEKAVAEGLK